MGELSQADQAKRTRGAAPILDHEALLTLARKVCAAATDADVGHLTASARELEHALLGHLQHEAVTMRQIPPGDERILNRGQERLWSAVTGLVWDADHGCPHAPGYCASRAEELLALLTLQAHDEHRVFSRRVA